MNIPITIFSNPLQIYTLSQDKETKCYNLTIHNQLHMVDDIIPTIMPVSSTSGHLKTGKCISLTYEGQLLATGGADGILWVRNIPNVMNSASLNQSLSAYQPNRYAKHGQNGCRMRYTHNQTDRATNCRNYTTLRSGFQ